MIMVVALEQKPRVTAVALLVVEGVIGAELVSSVIA